MSGSGKMGPPPAYHRLPATPTCPPYPVQQGPSLAPRGAPLNYVPAPCHDHLPAPRQPYITGCSVPQADKAYGRPPHEPPPYGKAPVDYPHPPQGLPPYRPVFPVGYGYPPLGHPPFGRQRVFPPGCLVPEMPTYRPPPGGTVMIEGGFDFGAHFDGGAKPTVNPPRQGWRPSYILRSGTHWWDSVTKRSY